MVGSLVALGLHLALREWVFAAAGVVGVTEIGGELWLALALRVAGAVVGGVLAGAGRPQSFSTGAMVGMASAVAWLAVDAFPDVTFDLIRVGLAGAVIIGGGASAVVGGVIWPPPVEVKPPEASHNSSLFKLKTTDGRRKGRPIAWIRVIIAATIALCGVLSADLIRQGLSFMPKGTFTNLTMTARSDALISGFIGVVAGVVAGSCTGRGWLHGMIGGFAAAVAVVSVSATLPDGPPLPVQYVWDVSGLESPGAGMAAAAGALMVIVTVAGWFGGQLFPVLRRRVRLGD